MAYYNPDEEMEFHKARELATQIIDADNRDYEKTMTRFEQLAN